VAAFTAEMGGALTPGQRLAVDRAAQLVALAEDARARRLGGDMAITLEDVVRTDNAAARAVRQLGIGATAAATPPPSLAAWAQQAAPPRPGEGEVPDDGSDGGSNASPSEPSSGPS
jgi:hypothetical protein